MTERRAGELRVEHWGLVAYDEALRRQLELHARRVAGEIADTLVVVSHPPTFTLGRRAPLSDVVFGERELARRGVAVVRSDRGGRATYHGPGQVVVYPIVGIEDLGLGVKDWVCLLEGALIETLASYSIEGRRHAGTAGIWAGEGDLAGKIASLGLRISRGASYHGVSLNVCLDASIFDGIVTCGVRGERVTTIAEMTASTRDQPEESEVAERLVGRIAARIADAASGDRGSRSTGRQ